MLVVLTQFSKEAFGHHLGGEGPLKTARMDNDPLIECLEIEDENVGASHYGLRRAR